MSTACLVAIMSMGLGYDRGFERESTDVARANGSLAPVLTAAGAPVGGVKILGARGISLMAPYMRPLTDLVVKYIENEGIEVIDSICFEILDNLEVGARDPLQLIDDVRHLNTQGGCRRSVRVRADALAPGDSSHRGYARNPNGIDPGMYRAVDPRSAWT